MQLSEVRVTEHQQAESDGREGKPGGTAKMLTDGEIAQLVLASSLSATRPLRSVVSRAGRGGQ
jgi:hypothetical protein